MGIWNPTILNPDFLKIRFKWLGFRYGYSCSPNCSKTGPFKILMLMSRFQMVFDKMAAICPNFKWLGLQISDPIWNLYHLQPNLFLIIQNPDLSGFQISIVLTKISLFMSSVTQPMLEMGTAGFWGRYYKTFYTLGWCKKVPKLPFQSWIKM